MAVGTRGACQIVMSDYRSRPGNGCGIFYDADRMKWQVIVYRNGIRLSLGKFDTSDKAHMVQERARLAGAIVEPQPQRLLPGSTVAEYPADVRRLNRLYRMWQDDEDMLKRQLDREVHSGDMLVSEASVRIELTGKAAEFCVAFRMCGHEGEYWT